MKRANQSRRPQLLARNDVKPAQEVSGGERAPSGTPSNVAPHPLEFRSRSELITIPIGSDQDIVKARQEGRRIAGNVGFSAIDLVLVATSISELARNIVRYARKGEIAIRPVTNSAQRGIEIIARDEGPGIKDVEQVLQVGFSTSASLGLGLPGVRRLMDEFEIQSRIGHGTIVIAKKWKS